MASRRRREAIARLLERAVRAEERAAQTGSAVWAFLSAAYFAKAVAIGTGTGDHTPSVWR